MVYNPGMSMYRNRNRNNRDTRGSSLPELPAPPAYTPPVTGIIDDGRALSVSPPGTAFLRQAYIVPLAAEGVWLLEAGSVAIGDGSDGWTFFGGNF